ncbi:DUF6159 family protein [Gordonia sp. C13]|uniref:DUF6159 family protein n=1 Tax=Gordonia sp. C13 TaxID=2935078 RepID=UPI00200B49B8|nr:DUF6159 family protein [Gordonia sp. C13]MCK8615781.1 DUF6159 family protein [Gordonia sp. C13]
MASSWEILKASARILRSRKELTMFPVLSGCTLGILTIALGVLVVSIPALRDSTAGLIIVVAVFYFLGAYVLTFWQAALISQADVTLDGGDPSVASGIARATRAGVRLAPWTAIVATVSYLLDVAERRLPQLNIVLDMAWNVTSFQVLPMMVLEDESVPGAVRRAREAFREVWGRNILGVASTGLISLVPAVPGAVLIWLALTELDGAMIVVVALIGILFIAAGAVIASALKGIYQTVLHHYLVDRRMPEAFGGIDGSQLVRTRRSATA